MMDTRLVVVTATASADRFHAFASKLNTYASAPVPIVALTQGHMGYVALHHGAVAHQDEYAGVVPAFARACELALRAYPHAEVIACLHDDVLLYEVNWDQKLLAHFDQYPTCGLAGFGGAWGLGDPEAGQGQYRPTWLVRRGFMSNMRDAEVHGSRVRTACQVACLDGFSQVFRREFLCKGTPGMRTSRIHPGETLFHTLESWGVVHHAYDAATGAFARQLGWDAWLLPFDCHHLGGQTAVGDAAYQEWAKTQTGGRGDQQFWEEAHAIIWTKLGHLLPFEVPHG